MAPQSAIKTVYDFATGMSENSSEQSASYTESPLPLSRIGLNSHKAGMDGLDKAKINSIILQASKGSK